MNFYEAQNCDSVQREEVKDTVAYSIFVDIPQVNSAIPDGLYLFALAKSVTPSATIYKLVMGANATVSATRTNGKAVRFQFVDESVVIKTDPSYEDLPLLDGKIMYPPELDLSLAELVKMKNGLLVSISFAGSKILIAEPLSKAIKQAANCLVNIW